MLLHSDERIDKAVAFCWDTQKLLHRMRFEGWHPLRIKEHVKSRAQLWRRYPSGIRTSAHQIFMEQLREQLKRPQSERDTTKPVWLNEQFELCPVEGDIGAVRIATDDTGAGGIIETPGARIGGN